MSLKGVDSDRKQLIPVHCVGDPAPWMAPQSSSYVNEAHVQEVLASSPHWVPGVPERSLS